MSAIVSFLAFCISHNSSPLMSLHASYVKHPIDMMMLAGFQLRQCVQGHLESDTIHRRTPITCLQYKLSAFASKSQEGADKLGALPQMTSSGKPWCGFDIQDSPGSQR